MYTQRRIVYVFAACFVLLMGEAVMAQDGAGLFNAFVKGKYQHNGSTSCATGDTPESIGSGPPQHITFTGITIYDGRGNATVTEHGIVIGNGTPFSFEDSCTGTYEVSRDGSIKRESTCIGSNGSYKLSGIRWAGQVSSDHLVVNLSSAELAVQKLEAPAEAPTFIQYRICGGLETEVRILH